MSLQSWGETLISSQVDGTAVTGTTAAAVEPPAARFTLPANFFVPGKVLRINAWGRISNIITTPGTLTLDVRFNTSSVVFNGGALSLNGTAAKTNVSWRLIMMLTCRTIGNGTVATLLGQGDFTSESVVGSAAGVANDAMLPASAPAVGTGFDSTVAQTVDLFATFSLTGNSLTSHQYTLESMN
jgi:hypothetical protein